MTVEVMSIARLAAMRAADVLRGARPSASECQQNGSSHSIVTPYDLESEAVIIRTIRDAFPGSSIVSEEMPSPEVVGPPFWAVDPIDGSSYFVRQLSSYSVSIAFITEHGVEGAVVLCPGTGELFEAEKGSGAFLNGERLLVSAVANPKDAIISLGHRVLRDRLSRAGALDLVSVPRSMRGGGSCAQELAYLAAGRLDVVVAARQSIWDYAAGLLLVTEAGGRLAGFSGTAPSTAPDVNRSQDLVASNGLLHPWALPLVAP